MKNHIILSLLMLAVIPGKTQELISFSGDTYKSSQISLSWSVGEIATEAYLNNSMSLFQGMQQPLFLKDTATTIKNSLLVDFSLKLFPNPSSGKINIDFASNCEEFDVYIFELSGRLAFQKRYSECSSVTIDLGSQPKGVYFVKVIAGSNQNLQKLILN